MTLQLANNKIGEAGAVALLHAARQSGTLTTLDLRGNVAAIRAKAANPAAFKIELGCNMLLLHALGAEWPEQSTAKTSEAISAALQVRDMGLWDIVEPDDSVATFVCPYVCLYPKAQYIRYCIAFVLATWSCRLQQLR